MSQEDQRLGTLLPDRWEKGDRRGKGVGMVAELWSGSHRKWEVSELEHHSGSHVLGNPGVGARRAWVSSLGTLGAQGLGPPFLL